MFAVKKTDSEYKEDQIMTTITDKIGHKLQPIKEDLNKDALEKQRYRLTIRKEARDLDNTSEDNTSENEADKKYNKILKEYVELMTHSDDIELKNKELKNETTDLKKQLDEKVNIIKNMVSDNTELSVQTGEYIKEIENLEQSDKQNKKKINKLSEDYETNMYFTFGLIILVFGVVVLSYV